MKFPEKYVLGETQPEGTTIMECEICKRKFAIPNNEVDTMTAKICESESCGKIANEQAAMQIKNLMQTNKSNDVKTALGN